MVKMYRLLNTIELYVERETFVNSNLSGTLCFRIEIFS